MKHLEGLEDADFEQAEVVVPDPTCREMSDHIKDAFLTAEDRLAVYADRTSQVQEDAEKRHDLERLRGELATIKSTLDGMAECCWRHGRT